MTEAMKTVRVDCAGRSKAALLQAVGEALALPSWWGANLDALYDALTDLPSPVTLELVNWRGSRLGKADRAALEAVLEDVVLEAPRHRFLLVERAIEAEPDGDAA
ncbi:MAG: barstar family protein [Duodenibacillus sp.]|nr:barstar family protein [Duodenibacillus sp.]